MGGFFLLLYLWYRWEENQKNLKIQQDSDYYQARLKEERLTNRQDRQAVDDYFSLWIHQIKTPLTALQLLVNGEVPDKHLQRSMRVELLAIENYSNMAISYLKIQNLDRDLTISQVDLDQILKDLLKKYSVIFVDQKITLNYQPMNQKVLSDGRWLAVMIEQIISNAGKYTPGGEVSLYFMDERLYVADTGVGIHPEDLPKIFDRGYSGFNGRYNDKSSGFGLFLVQTIAERLGHPVQVQSTYGQGTTFSIYFPQTSKLTNL